MIPLSLEQVAIVLWSSIVGVFLLFNFELITLYIILA